MLEAAREGSCMKVTHCHCKNHHFSTKELGCSGVCMIVTVEFTNALGSALKSGAPGLWNTNTLCCLVPCLRHHESQDPDTLFLVHGSHFKSQALY